MFLLLNLGRRKALQMMILLLKNGCRPYLGIDSMALTGKWKGQLASAIGINGHNWMFPVAYGVFGSETKENWGWFMGNLALAIGSLERPRFSSKGKSTDTIYNAVDHKSNSSHYQLSADIIDIHRRFTSYKSLQHWLTHLLHCILAETHASSSESL
jgi:hypothetical protein